MEASVAATGKTTRSESSTPEQGYSRGPPPAEVEDWLEVLPVGQLNPGRLAPSFEGPEGSSSFTRHWCTGVWHNNPFYSATNAGHLVLVTQLLGSKGEVRSTIYDGFQPHPQHFNARVRRDCGAPGKPRVGGQRCRQQ